MAVLRVKQRNGVSVRHIQKLQIVGDVSADCSSYVAAFYPDLHGEHTIQELDDECNKKKPFFNLSLVSFPIGQARIDPNDEEFVRFVITNSFGALSFPGEMQDYFGFDATKTRPKLPMHSPPWFLLLNFSKVNSTDLTWYGPVLREEVKNGSVKFQAVVDDETINIAPQEIRFPWTVSLADFQVDKIIPQDLFYGIDNGNRVALPTKKDPLIK